MKITSNLGVDKQQQTADLLIGLIEGALTRWYNGDPYGYLELYDRENYSYFDPVKTTRLDGFEAVKALYDSIKGIVHCTDWKIVDPHVQLFDRLAVVTCNIIAHVGTDVVKWNSTEAFVLNEANKWKIVHSNWAFMRPMDMVFNPEKQII